VTTRRALIAKSPPRPGAVEAEQRLDALDMRTAGLGAVRSEIIRRIEGLRQ